MVSSAANLPITNASFRLVVVWMGARSIRWTNAGARESDGSQVDKFQGCAGAAVRQDRRRLLSEA
jgi:hypothetical protein